ncbi:MAG: cation transporter [Gammaproteobacteria bacterium]
MNATVSPAIRLKIQGMDCGSCALTIEQAVKTVPGIDSVRVDFTTETLEATGSASRDQIEARVKTLGYRIGDGTEAPQAPRPELRGFGGFLRYLVSERRTQIALAASLLLIVAGVVGMSVVWPLLEAALLATVVVVGAPILVKGLRSLLVARHVTIDLLMGIATVGAVAIGETGEAAAVVLLFTLGEALEAYSAERSRDALRSLLSLQPDEATVLEEHRESHDEPAHAEHKHGAACTGAGHDHDHEHDHEQHDHGQDAHKQHDHEQHDHGQQHDHGHAPKSAPQSDSAGAEVHYHQRRRPTAAVPIGAHVLVKPGERIPLDGRILPVYPVSTRLPSPGKAFL